jgi:hypothetical protein
MKPSRRTAILAISMLALIAASAPLALASATPFSIQWTAPGDDSLSGRASVYDLRYSNLPITAANFLLAAQISGLPLPAIAGTHETFVVAGLTDGAPWYLAIKSADEAGNWSAISNVMARHGQATDVDPSALALSFSSPWPNPARESVRWAYTAPTAVGLQVDVFDASGRHVRSVASGTREAGRGELSWDLRDDRGGAIGAGVYFVRAHVGSMTTTKRLVVVR